METYYNPEDLAKFGTIGEKASELAEKFFAYYNAVFEEGALTAREKSLIALAVAHTVQCPYCIDAYTNDCLDKGVSEEQLHAMIPDSMPEEIQEAYAHAHKTKSA